MDNWWNAEKIGQEQSDYLCRALDAVERQQSVKACEIAAKAEASDARSLTLGYAYSKQGKMKRSIEELAPLLLANDSSLTPAGYNYLKSLLREVATKYDPFLAKVMNDADADVVQHLESEVVKSFYFGGALGGDTLYQQVQRSEKKLNRRVAFTRTIRPQFRIEMLKLYSSYTPLTELSDASLGGGYFLVADKFGCVIDPGHDFIGNFLKRHDIADIDAIIVTHCHDDHNADLPALLSLLYRKNPKNKVQLYLDKHTYNAQRHIIEASSYIQQPCLPISASQIDWRTKTFIELSPKVRFRPIPACHKITPKDDGTSAVGLHFILENQQVAEKHLVISGDTAWGKISEVYRELGKYKPVLVAHVSTACEEEAKGILGLNGGGYHGNHLGVRGTVEMVSICRPSCIVLSEIGEELKDVIDTLATRIHSAFNIPCYIGMMDNPNGEIIDLASE